MNGKQFFDTNIFGYSLDASDGPRIRVARALLRSAVETRTGVVSYQVFQELFNIGFRKFRPAMTATEARNFLEGVSNEFEVVAWSPGLVQKALSLRERHLFQWFDCLIIAAALEAECDVLYTEDMQHGQRIEGLHVINPFR